MRRQVGHVAGALEREWWEGRLVAMAAMVTASAVLWGELAVESIAYPWLAGAVAVV